MQKYCDLYYTTQRHVRGERNNSTPLCKYSWHIRNKEGEQLQSSFENDEGYELFGTREEAEQEAKQAIQDYYS